MKRIILLGFFISCLKGYAQDRTYSDGPYFLYTSDSLLEKRIVLVNTAYLESKREYELTEKPVFAVYCGRDSFFVRLKDKVNQIEPCIYPRQNKLYVLSDLEGNFKRFVSLLTSGGVINAKLQWIFGDGHLVLNGDFFDRGKNVTELLWLIYSLEDQAKAAGGYVHFILGNHEIMNLYGDLRYLHPKYRHSQKVLQTEYKTMYGVDSELGRWLRSKNIIEKVGDLLFVHAGISPQVNVDSRTIEEINKVCRPYYSTPLDPQNFMGTGVWHFFDGMGSSPSPFWYRGYYLKNGSPMSQVDSTLTKFKVSHIVTGHTIVADTVSLHYGGKVINTDTRGNKSTGAEGLLIENGSFYRIDEEGDKVLLFKKKNKTKNKRL